MPASETTLISTIAIGLGFALLGGFLASKARLSPIVGYLLAGIVIGPFTPGLVGNTGVTEELAEIGVILLLFGVGLHFSLRDLLAVWRIAVPGAVAQLAAAAGLGAVLGHGWGWPPAAGLIFGVALAASSTVVMLRALEAQGLLGSEAGRIAVGWLVVADLLMVLTVVLLPALADAAAHPAALGTDLALTLGKLAAFILLMLVIGARVLPWLLDQIERTGSRELFSVAVIAAAIGVAFAAAALFGLSYALGAFLAGLVIGESDHSHRAAQDSQPLQDAFGVLFFVGVGMLFDPAIVHAQPWKLLAALAVVVIGNALVVSAAVLAFRYPLATALTIGAGFAQIGEFSFVIAAAGQRSGVLSQAGHDLIIAVALLSITLNPLLFWLARRFAAAPRARPV